MKRFRFSLQTLLNVKESVKKQRQAELAQAQHHADRCREALDATRHNLRTRMRRFAEKGGKSVDEMQLNAKHFVFLRDRIEQQKLELIAALEELKRKQEAAIEIMQEVKVLEKLREKQFAAYLEEVKLEQEKEIGDFVSYLVGKADTASEGER